LSGTTSSRVSDSDCISSTYLIFLPANEALKFGIVDSILERRPPLSGEQGSDKKAT